MQTKYKTLKTDKIFVSICRNHNSLVLTILPFEYVDGKPRLPRKKSKGYNLKGDTEKCLTEALASIETDMAKRFAVTIKIYRGSDGLGGADLDNYAKALLDGITTTKKIWTDDEQVDKLEVERFISSEVTSKMIVIIERTLTATAPNCF